MPETTPWILGDAPGPAAEVRLFCFPYAGAGASVFHGWRAGLSEKMAVCPVQLPGRENRLREAAFTEMAPLVEAAAQALRPFLTPPFALFGHSLGALAAFETARLLRREGAPAPACLFVSGCPAPQLQQPPDRPLHLLPRDEFVAELRRLQGTPDAVLANDEMLDLLLPTLRADFAVLETYRCRAEEPLPCPVVALGGRDDDRASREDLAAWSRQTTASFHLHFFPGGHFFLRTDPGRVLDVVRASLHAVAPAHSERDADSEAGPG